MAFQVSVNQFPVIGMPGQVTDATPATDDPTVFAEVDNTAAAPLEDPVQGILPGHLVVQGTEFKQARLPHALAADVDAIVVSGVSAAAPQDLTALAFDGVVGGTRWPVPTLLNVVFNSHTDWDATNFIVTGIDENGAIATDTISIPDAGNATVPSVIRFVQITRIQIDAQTGANGTYTLGVQGPASAVLTKGLIWGISRRDEQREGTFDLNGIPAASDGLGFVNTQNFTVSNFNKVWVETEDVVLEGAPAWARVVNTAAAGLPSNLGQFRSDGDSGNALLVPGARFQRVSGGTRAEIRVNFRD